MDTDNERTRAEKQTDTISELQRTISQLNVGRCYSPSEDSIYDLQEKMAAYDAVILEEKNLRRKLEREQERAKDDHTHVQGALDKLQQKYDVLVKLYSFVKQ